VQFDSLVISTYQSVVDVLPRPLNPIDFELNIRYVYITTTHMLHLMYIVMLRFLIMSSLSMFCGLGVRVDQTNIH
jgi:hypothetical protein